MRTNILKSFIFLFVFLVNYSLVGESCYILCIDGGGSKTLLQVVDEKGQLVTLQKDAVRAEKIETSGSNINSVGKNGIKTALDALFMNVQIAPNHLKLIDILPKCKI